MQQINFCLVCVAVLLAAVIAINGEAPGGGYSYNRPSSGGSFSFGGGSGFGGLGGSGGGYRAVPSGITRSEGQQVDPQLLEQVRQIIVREESKASSGAGSFGGLSSSYGAPQSSYGVPQQSYGPPSQGGARVSDVSFEGIRQAIQVAQFEQSSGGYAGGAPSSSYGAPSSSYGAPSSSYGAPSSSYGVPQ